MQHKVIFWLIFLFTIMVPSIVQSEPIEKIPDFSVYTIDGRSYQYKGNEAVCILFFDAAQQKNFQLFKSLNKISFAFRMYNLKVFAIYSDLERLEREEWQKNLKESHFDYLKQNIYQDTKERNVLKKFGLQKAPAIFIGNSKRKVVYQNTESQGFHYENIKHHVKLALGVKSRNLLLSTAAFIPKAKLLAESEVPEPVKPEPVKPEPVKPEPVKPEPVKPEPVKPEPVKPEPVKPEPVKPEPVKPEPVKPEPVKPEPVKPEPVKPEPVKPEPVKPEPVKPEPVKPEPVKPEPVKPEPVKPEPVKPEPVKPEPVKPEPVTAVSQKDSKVKSLKGIFDTKSDTLGQRPLRWNLAKTPEDMLFFLVVDLLVMLTPIFIWGWGMLYTLGKIKRYRGMFIAFIGCLGFFAFHLWYLSLRIPYQICFLLPELSMIKIQATKGYQICHNLIPIPARLYLNVEMLGLILFQCALIKGIAGKIKDEEKA